MKKIVLLVLAIILALFTTLYAAENEAGNPTIYVIKQGDTLWGLSERFLKDPYYWPKMWAKNSQITNPHFIYPGQKVRIFPDRIEFVPKDEAATSAQKASAPKQIPTAFSEAAAKEQSFVVRGSEGYIAEDRFLPDGVIISINHNRVMAGMDDIVYTDLGNRKGAKSGDKYDIFKIDREIEHPVTKRKIGTKLYPVGTLQLTDVEGETSRAIVTSSFREISVGAALMAAKHIEKREIVLKESKSSAEGYIVESFTGTGIIAAGDIVYIDLGKNDGIEDGNMLYVVREMKQPEKFYEAKKPNLPQELIGAVVVVDAKDRSSTALVIKSVEAIVKGDKLSSPNR